MSTDDQMNIDERYKYLRRMQKRYMRADRQEQGRLLDEMELITELHRKSLVRLLRSDLARQPRRQPREAWSMGRRCKKPCVSWRKAPTTSVPSGSPPTWGGWRSS